MVKWTRNIYLVSAWLFVTLVLVQVFLAGMVVVAWQIDWSAHRGLGHSLGLPLLVMLVTAYLGSLPRSVKRLTWLLLGVYIVQADIVIFLRTAVPVLSALHPVLALVDFAVGLFLAYKAVGFVRQAADTTVVSQRAIETAD